jgi:hypothetical protein
MKKYETAPYPIVSPAEIKEEMIRREQELFEIKSRIRLDMERKNSFIALSETQEFRIDE